MPIFFGNLSTISGEEMMYGFTLLSYLRSVIAGRATPQIPAQESVGAKLQSRVYAPGCHNPVTLKESTLNLEEYKTAVDEADGEADQVLIKKTKFVIGESASGRNVISK